MLPSAVGKTKLLGESGVTLDVKNIFHYLLNETQFKKKTAF
jgi:hypothetical protein